MIVEPIKTIKCRNTAPGSEVSWQGEFSQEIPLYDHFVFTFPQVSAFSNNWRQHAEGDRADLALPCPNMLLERCLYIQNQIQTKVLPEKRIQIIKMLEIKQ